MTRKNITSRTAMTAIAAVIGLSSIPAFAQDASVPDPVIDTATKAPDPVTPDPLAPEEATTTSAAPESETPAAKPAKASAAKTTPASRRAAAPSSKSRQPAETAPIAPAAATEAPAEVPVPIAEAAPPVAEPAAPIVAETTPASQNDMLEDIAPVAGAAGLGLFALAGAGVAMRRRRRRREDEEFEANQQLLAEGEAEPDPQPSTVAPEPAFARMPTPVHDPVQIAAPATALPAGFDLSRFGRHVQAAYRGPTPDNPSLSLKNRLRRASFFDQQERRDAGKAKPEAQPAWMSRKPSDAEFMFRPAAKKQGLKPAFQG